MGCSPPCSSVHGNSPDKNTRVGCCALLQGIFPFQRLNPGLLHCRWILYRLSHQGSPRILEWVADPISRGSSQPGNRTGFCWLQVDSLPDEQTVISSVPQSCLTLCDPMDCSTQGLTVHRQLPEFTQTYVHWVGEAIQPSYPLLSPFPPAFSVSQHQGLRIRWHESVLRIRWPKYWSFSFSISPFNEYSGLISFRMDWFDLLAV